MRNWSGFGAGTDEAILSLPDIMLILSTPRHRTRLSGNYISSAPDHAPIFFERLREVTGASTFWDPNPR
ncbi:MAG TPA: hypothetical protein VN328_05465 [Thermodesulfovibrionales bacterium]|nr:hypothetical protein [Thermodesulfovibrionales bacterium]